MKPAWDQLMESFADSPYYLVADVDCTADGKSLCTEQGVRGYPTIMYGDPSDLEKYTGGRDFDSLKKFADNNLKPLCSLTNMDLCTAEQKAKIEEFKKLDASALDAKITSSLRKIKEAEAEHKNKIATLEKEFKEYKSSESSSIGLMKAVKKSKDTKDEL